ncbi:hypothetical protein [Thauera humireducens]|uniref:hypothetical protein n=1 Tax=Thauera humireducens TaxID=1134435 RepID=UPI00311E02FB
MLKVFSHYFPSHTLQQVLFDAVLFFVVVLLAVGLLAGLGDPEWMVFTPSALTFALLMVGLNTAMGLYRPVLQRSSRQAFARVALSLVVSVPVAYAVFGLHPAVGGPGAAFTAVECCAVAKFDAADEGIVNQRQASGCLHHACSSLVRARTPRRFTGISPARCRRVSRSLVSCVRAVTKGRRLILGRFSLPAGCWISCASCG